RRRRLPLGGTAHGRVADVLSGAGSSTKRAGGVGGRRLCPPAADAPGSLKGGKTGTMRHRDGHRVACRATTPDPPVVRPVRRAGLEPAWPVGETGDLTRSQTSRAAEGEGVEPSRVCGLVPVRAGCHRRLACPSVFLAPSSTAADDACDKLFSFGRT